MKSQYIKAVLFVVFVITVCIAAVKNSRLDGVRVDAENSARRKSIIILDAGHGGEDGGAVAADGTNEKDINLAITKKNSRII